MGLLNFVFFAVVKFIRQQQQLGRGGSSITSTWPIFKISTSTKRSIQAHLNHYKIVALLHFYVDWASNGADSLIGPDLASLCLLLAAKLIKPDTIIKFSECLWLFFLCLVTEDSKYAFRIAIALLFKKIEPFFIYFTYIPGDWIKIIAAVATALPHRL